jgi:hypothetical protein
MTFTSRRKLNTEPGRTGLCEDYAVSDLSRRHADLDRHHAELSAQLLATVTTMIRDRSYARQWGLVDNLVDELAVVVAELTPLEAQLREQQKQNLVEHREAVAQRLAAIEREKAASLEALRQRRDAEWGNRHVGVKGGFF